MKSKLFIMSYSCEDEPAGYCLREGLSALTFLVLRNNWLEVSKSLGDTSV